MSLSPSTNNFVLPVLKHESVLLPVQGVTSEQGVTSVQGVASDSQWQLVSASTDHDRVCNRQQIHSVLSLYQHH